MGNEIKPIRIMRSRKHKQESQNGLPIVYVGRPSIWGNPYRVIDIGEGCYNVFFVIDGFQQLIAWALPKDMALELAITRYREGIRSVDLIKKELKGKNLSCWCKPNEPCHGDVLLEIANN